MRSGKYWVAVCFKTREESQWSLTFEVRKSLTFQDMRRARAALQWSLTFEVRKRNFSMALSWIP